MKHVSLCQHTVLTVLFASCLVLLAATAVSGTAWANDLGKRRARVWEVVEYSLPNTTSSGNPFDLVASVTLSHAKESRTTEMSYARKDAWKSRFTGTQAGVWTFLTSSSDSDLDGHTGAVTVGPRARADS